MRMKSDNAAANASASTERIFVTGTDTNCGKTYVTGHLVDYYNSIGKKTLSLKPIASGCSEINGQLYNTDVSYLKNCNLRYHADNYPINRWLLPEPIAPHIAAQKSGITLSVQELQSFCYNEIYNDLDYLLIEGAGGLLVPLNEQETWLDFLSAMKVIVVVGIKLGCINHALLTATVLENNRISCLGWIANCLDASMLALEQNISTLSSKMPMPLLGVMAHGEGFNPKYELLHENLLI